jgi:serine/threonine protein kinase
VSEQSSAPEDHAPQAGGHGLPPSETPQPAPSAPASTTNLGRFPEKSETGEITTFLAPEAPSQAIRSGANAPRAMPPPIPSGIGTRLPLNIDPQIEIERRISAGGMGEVFLGLQKHLGRKVAVKRIRDWGADAATKDRFIHEAKAQSRLQHPGIAQVHDLREAEGEFYLIMEYVEGRTLEEILAQEGKFAPDKVVSIGVQLTEALEAAAHEGYIHRDLKPGNVMLTAAGKVKIIDFGLALLIRNLRQTRFTEKGEVLGTPAFMSPEQLNQEEHLDIRSDIWSLGVLLYTIATAETPFTGKDFVCTVKNVMMADPVPLPTLEPGFPPGLWLAIARALKKDRAERWQDYASFREALVSSRQAEDARPAGDSKFTQDSRRSTKRRVALFLGAVSIALGIAAGARYLPFGAERTPSSTGKHAREESSPRPAPPPEPTSGEDPKDLVPSPSPVAESLAKGSVREPAPAAVAKPPPPSLREKLVGYALSEEEVAFVGEVLGVFSRLRPQLLAKDYQSIEQALLGLERDRLGVARDAEPPPGKEYMAGQVRAAARLVDLAQGAFLARLEELRRSKESEEKVSIVLVDGSVKVGRVEAIEKGAFLLNSNPASAPTQGSADQVRVPFAEIAPESLRGAAAPGPAQLALLALSGGIDASFREIVDLGTSRDEWLFSIPLVVRLARLEVEAIARRAALAVRENATTKKEPRGGDGEPLSARVAALAAMLAERKAEILRLFGHTKSDVEAVEREASALLLLGRGEYAALLATGKGTAAFPVAAELLRGRLEAEIAGAHDELLAGTGWHGYGWRLFPDEASVKERTKYWDLEEDGGGSILRADGVERRLVMGRGSKRAPEGLILRIAFEAGKGAQGAAHWRFLVRNHEGSPIYLRFDDAICGLYRTRLEPGAADLEVTKGSLPPLKKAGERVIAFLPLEGRFHLFVDGEHVLGIAQADATIPSQLSLAVTQGKLSIKSVKAKKSAGEEDDNR